MAHNILSEDAHSKSAVTTNAAVEHNCFMCSRPDTEANLVGCDKCSNWAHYDCAGVESSIEATEKSWICAPCRSSIIGEIALSTASKAGSRTSKQSLRIEENLKMLQDQKEMELRALDKEEEDRKEFRKKRLEIEKQYIKQKYDVQREGSQSNRSDRSQTSSRNSRRIVENWLAKEPIGAQLERVAALEFPPQPTNIEPSVSVARAMSSISLNSPPHVPLVPKSASTPYAGQTIPLLAPVVLPDMQMPQLTVASPSGSRLVPRVSVPQSFSQNLCSALPSTTHANLYTAVCSNEIASAELVRRTPEHPGIVDNRPTVPPSFSISPDISSMRCFANSINERRPLSTISEETFGNNFNFPSPNIQQQPIFPISTTGTLIQPTVPNSGSSQANSVIQNCANLTIPQDPVCCCYAELAQSNLGCGPSIVGANYNTRLKLARAWLILSMHNSSNVAG